MCLGIPGKIVEINGDKASAMVAGVKKTVDLTLMDRVVIGEYVLIHAGFAIERIDEQKAQETLNLMERFVKDKR